MPPEGWQSNQRATQSQTTGAQCGASQKDANPTSAPARPERTVTIDGITLTRGQAARAMGEFQKPYVPKPGERFRYGVGRDVYLRTRHDHPARDIVAAVWGFGTLLAHEFEVIAVNLTNGQLCAFKHSTPFYPAN